MIDRQPRSRRKAESFLPALTIRWVCDSLKARKIKAFPPNGKEEIPRIRMERKAENLRRETAVKRWTVPQKRHFPMRLAG